MVEVTAWEDGTVTLAAADEATCLKVSGALKKGRSPDAHQAWATSPWNVGRLVVTFRPDQAKPVLDALAAAGVKEARAALAARRKAGIKTPKLRHDPPVGGEA